MLAFEREPEITVIRPRSGWQGLGLTELVRYHELLYFLVWRDLKVRYKQTVFGALWAVIQPVALMVVFTLVLGRVSGIATKSVPYPLFAFVALVPWTFFAQSVIGSSGSLVNASNLLQKVYFPRLLLPIASVCSYLVDYAIALVVLGVLMVYFGVAIPLTLVALVPLSILAFFTALAVGIWLSAINVQYRDVRYAVPFLLQVLLFASPVAYSTAALPGDWQLLTTVNPMSGVIDGFRWAVLGDPAAPAGPLLAAALVTGLLLITGLAYFRRVERTFADVI